jgi:hypothetical protein
MTSLHLRAIGLLSLAVICCRADDGTPRAADEEAVQREIIRLDSIKPRPSTRPLNNVSFAYELGLNIRTRFTGFAGVPGNSAGPATPGTNHEYQDGYNRVDSQGNNHSDQGFPNTTTYWGYQNASQWNHNNNTVEMHSSFVKPFTDSNNDDARHGFQILYERIICNHDKWYWGVEAGFGFTKIDVTETQIEPVMQMTDAYAIPADPLFGGHSIPAAPYQGPYSGDLGSSLLSDVPIRTFAPDPNYGPAFSTRHLDANVWRVHLGPKLHIPLHRRLEFEVSGGLAIGVVDSQFSFSDQAFVSSGSGSGGSQPPIIQRGNGDKLGTLVGGYISGNLVYPLWPDSKIFAGGQWEDLGTYRHSVGTHLAEVDFTGAVSFSVGLSLGF